MTDNSMLSILISMFTLITLVIGLVIVFVKIGSFKGTMEERVKNQSESIGRAFTEIEQVRNDHTHTSHGVISILTGIEYLKSSMSEMKQSIEKMRENQCKE